MDFKYKSQKEVNELTDEQVEVYAKELKAHEAELNKKAIEKAVKDSETELKNDFAEKLKAIQEQADAMDKKMQVKQAEKANEGDFLVKAIKENKDNVLRVEKGNAAKIQIKAVADMTTGNLTGDEPRDYNFDIVKFPAQKVNIADIARNVSITGGTYTFTREGAGEGSIGAQTEGATKNQRDYDFTTVDVSTDFIAGFARYSRKMRNNLSYITSSIPMLLRRDYFKAENAAFQTILAAQATASTETITGSSKAGMIINEIGKLEDADYSDTNLIVVKPTDYLDILKTAKQDLASAVTYEGGVLRIAGTQVLKGSSWLPANKYYVGDWSRVTKVNTEGLSLEFSEQEGTNFVKNMITARIESQTALTVEQPAALIYGDFTAADE